MLHSSLLRSILLLILFSVSGGSTIAESLFQTSGGDAATPSQDTKQHTRLNGKPCIDLGSYAKSEIVDKNLFEHWITATNNCGQHIELQVCYYQSSDCIVMKVPPWESKSAVLGIYPQKEFRFNAKEKF
jgi:putative aminopeptidase FrvX